MGALPRGPSPGILNIRFFGVKDHTKAHGIGIRHCPTLQMLGDFFTKPLQGALFTRFRDVLLGYAHVDSLHYVAPTPPVEERVEGNTSTPGDNGTDDEENTHDNVWITVTSKKTRKNKSNTVNMPRSRSSFREPFSRNNPGNSDKV